MKRMNNGERAFTLMEMLFVIVIMSMIAVGLVQYTNQFAQNKLIQKTAVDIQRILNQAQYYYVLNEHWPTDLSSLEGVALQSPWPGGSTRDSCNRIVGSPAPKQCYQGAQVSGANYYQVSVTVPSQLTANKIKTLLPQGTVNGTEVIAYGAAYGGPQTQLPQDKRITVMDTAYCNSYSSHVSGMRKSYPDGACGSAGSAGSSVYATISAGSCSGGDKRVLFPILGSWERGPNPLYSGSKDCQSDVEVGLYTSAGTGGTFKLYPFHVTTINSGKESDAKTCLSKPLLFSGYQNSSFTLFGGSSVFYFAACMPNVPSGTPAYPGSYNQWATPYNVGFYGDGSGGVYDGNGNYGVVKPPKPFFN